MDVQFAASFEVWIWNAVAYAVSQFSVTWQNVCVAPRSTWSHCGSLNAEDQRVPVLPSVALAAGVPAFSAEDAVVGLFSARLVAVLQVSPPPELTVQLNETFPVAP